jgi:hypothetical protein
MTLSPHRPAVPPPGGTVGPATDSPSPERRRAVHHHGAAR